MEYCFSKNHNFLDIPDFRSPFLEAVNNLETGVHVLVHFPWLLPIAKSLPEAILPAQVRLVFDFKKVWVLYSGENRANTKKGNAGPDSGCNGRSQSRI
jgi:hypothetical protein